MDGGIKEVVDGLLYGLVMGGTFGWLWPKGEWDEAMSCETMAVHQ